MTTRKLIEATVRVYAVLLHLYPRDFRQAYGDPMVQLLRDQCHDAVARRGVLGLLPVWLRTLLDLVVTVFREHVDTRFQWLTPAAVIFIAVFFGSRYIRIPIYLAYYAIHTFSLPSWLREALSSSFWMPLFADHHFSVAFFTSVPVYVGLSILGIGLAVAALVLARPRLPGRLALILAQVSILALPLLYTYSPAVTVNPRRARVHVPTQPGPLTAVVKSTQVGVELRRCDYTLLGWDEGDSLYGEEICGTRHRYWRYWPMSRTRLRTVDAVPPDLLRQEVDREGLSTLGVGSIIPQDEALRTVVPEPGLSSQQGWWTAFVARHVYGPEDVVVLMGGAHTH